MAPCLVTYTVDPIWVNGFSASVAVTNRSIIPPTGQVTMELPENAAAQIAWNAILTVGNQWRPVLTLPAYHPNVVIGETYTFGFNGTYTGVYDPAYGFRLDGPLCDVVYN
ncbi:cellulose binding domain-containing protein [Nonomuraea sp. NEAU-A123]|uniref:cellulose binding domain-containing protein n=1 Tax=Nonomuraea sp. NEAU-A123 TaxID=2839649 RepID=UPI001BE3F2BE|nr:cellulose binding domain-containing protein [Nonomuraea sp. NEAU-A123]MBT2227210.1 cellulose binding domain-containing protein [Nonomuraea sp. NEAU-A123]